MRYAKIRKISIGVLFGRPNFAISESIGEISEDIIESMNGRILEEEFFSEIAVQSGASLDLRSNDKTRILHLDASTLLYTRDHYNQSHTVEWNKIKTEFTKIWGIIKQSRKLHEIRRIGIVSEYRIATKNNDQSNVLLDKLTKLPSVGRKKKFILTNETYYPVIETENFSPQTSEFINVIENYYDSTQDMHHSEDGFMALMLDVQHYYAPVVSSTKCVDEISKLYGIFLNHEGELKNRVKKLGLLDG